METGKSYVLNCSAWRCLRMRRPGRLTHCTASPTCSTGTVTQSTCTVRSFAPSRARRFPISTAYRLVHLWLRFMKPSNAPVSAPHDDRTETGLRPEVRRRAAYMVRQPDDSSGAAVQRPVRLHLWCGEVPGR